MFFYFSDLTALAVIIERKITTALGHWFTDKTHLVSAFLLKLVYLSNTP